MYKNVVPFGCGQCMACRKNKLRLWQHRLMLEGMCHTESCMVTLTYADEHIPLKHSLAPRDLQLFLKRLRRKLAPKTIRFFACGEYGERNKRPHYHIALFGVGKSAHHIINDAWGKGIIDTGYEGDAGKINKDSAQYICGYVTKKMTSWNDPKVKAELLAHGLHPEFCRMSNRPGIGYGVIPKLVDALTTSSGCEAIGRMGDVPMSLSHGGKSWPLGRYLRMKLREYMGFPVITAQEGWFEQSQIRAEEEMLELCVSEGVIGLLKKDEETQDTQLFKKINSHNGWRKALLQRRNLELDKAAYVTEHTHKYKGRKL